MTSLLIEQDQSAVILTMNRSEVLNALSRQLAEKMTETIRALAPLHAGAHWCVE